MAALSSAFAGETPRQDAKSVRAATEPDRWRIFVVFFMGVTFILASPLGDRPSAGFASA